MMKILLIVSAVFGLISALVVIFNACKKKTKGDWALVLVLLAATAVLVLQAFGIINLKLLAALVLACQLWVGLFLFFDGVTQETLPSWLSAIGGLITAVAACWWLISAFKWWAIVWIVGVVLVASIFLVMGLRKNFD